MWLNSLQTWRDKGHQTTEDEEDDLLREAGTEKTRDGVGLGCTSQKVRAASRSWREKGDRLSSR